MTTIIQHVHQLTETINAISVMLSLLSVVLRLRHMNQPAKNEQTARMREYRDIVFLSAATALSGVALVNAALSSEPVTRVSVVLLTLLSLMFSLGCLLIWAGTPKKS